MCSGQLDRHVLSFTYRIGLSPYGVLLVQPTASQMPDAVKHQHIHAVGPAVGKEVSSLRVGSTKCSHHARRCGPVRLSVRAYP